MTFKALVLLEILLFSLLLFLGSVGIVNDSETYPIADTMTQAKDTQSVDVKLYYFLGGLLGKELPDSTLNK